MASWPHVVCRRAWIAARKAALTEAEQASPLARRVYDLRHACLSTWLNAGILPTQVAQWTGHSVDVLLRIYAKCIDGQDEVAKRRISEALRGGVTAKPRQSESDADDQEGVGADTIDYSTVAHSMLGHQS